MLDQSALELSFNIFAFSKVALGKELRAILFYYFDTLHLFEDLDISQEVFFRFGKKIQSG